MFFIGGPDGLHPQLKATGDETIRMSDLTLPHAFARVMLAEALYRAWTGSPAIRFTGSDASGKGHQPFAISHHQAPMISRIGSFRSTSGVGRPAKSG